MGGANVVTAQEQQRLMWQCRRGMLELDILLQGFVDNGYADLSDSERQSFDDLLNYPDQELLEYFLEQAQPDDKDIANLVTSIRQAFTV